MRSRIQRVLFFVALVSAGAALGQDAPAAKPGPLKGDDVHASLVTLHAQKQTLKDVLDQLNQQTGIHTTLNGPADAPVTLDAYARPFWEVLCSICDQAHLGVPFNQGYDFSAGIPLVPGMEMSRKRRVVAGPVLAIFNRFGRLSQMSASPAIRDFCDIDTTVAWEPRLAVAYVEAFSKPSLAMDENGLSLVPSGDVIDPRTPAAEEYQSPVQYNRSTCFASHSIRLKIPRQAGRRLAHLSGQIRLWVISKSESLELGGLGSAAKSLPVLDNSQNLKVQNIWVNTGQAQIQLSASKSSEESADAWLQRRCLLREIRGKLLDADGNTWAELNGSAYVQGDVDAISIYLGFQRPGGLKSAPKKVVIDVPVSAVELDVPYELKDLPLP